MGNWSHSIRNEANGSNAPGRNRIHDEYSPGLNPYNSSGVKTLEAAPPVQSSPTHQSHPDEFIRTGIHDEYDLMPFWHIFVSILRV